MKCLKNMKLKQDFVLFGNAKYFVSDETFDFIIVFAKFFTYKWKLENKRPLFHVFQKQLRTKHKMEEYFSYINMEHASFRSKWILLYVPCSERWLNLFV